MDGQNVNWMLLVPVLALVVAFSTPRHADVDARQGAVHDRVPSVPDVTARHVIYLHGTSALLRNPRVNFVFLAACGDGDFSGSTLTVWGRILSVYEASDEIGRSCQSLFARSGGTGERTEVRIDTGERHGACYRPRDEWMAPVMRWVATAAIAGAPTKAGPDEVLSPAMRVP